MPKSYVQSPSTSEHGGHDSNTFVWDGDCANCHGSGSGSEAVVSDIHHGSCTLCHDNANGGPGTTIAGTDGDARKGAALGVNYASATCTTCHDATDYPKYQIHHVNDSSTNPYTVTNCTLCHNTTSGHAGDHTNMVSLAANCADCHTATAGGVDNVPVDSADAKVHNACTTCHYVDTANRNVVDLIDPAGSTLVTTMNNPDGTAATNNGGGDCEACHTAGFSSFHGSVVHTSMVSLATNCADCHTNTAAPANGPVPIDSADPKVHNDCYSCHGADGRLIGSASGNNGGTNGGNDGGGDCSTCHGAFDQNHGTSVDHSGMVALDANCQNCHSGTEAPSGGAVPIDSADPKKHNACGSCHGADGRLIGSASGKDGGTIGGSDGGGICSTCHGGFSANHASVAHDPMVTLSVNCADCHNGTQPGSGQPVPVDSADPKKHNSCGTCHDVDGSLIGSASGNDGGTVGGSDGGGDCEVCHTGGFTGYHGNVDHTSMVGLYANCSECHSGTEANGGGVPLDSADPKKHNACTSCHDGANGRLVDPAGTNYAVAMPNGGTIGGSDGGGTCDACHGEYFDNHVHGTTGGYVSHDVRFDATIDLSQASPGSPCYNCHDDAGLGIGSNALSTWDAIKTEHSTVGGSAQASACATCHDYATNGNQSGDADTPLLATVQSVIQTGTNNTCISCHVPKSFAHSPSTSVHGTIDHPAQGKVVGVEPCVNCHDNNNQADNTHYIYDIHGQSGFGCGTCHVSSSGGGPLHDYSAGGNIMPSETVNYEAINGGSGGTCAECHANYAADYQNNHQNATHSKVEFGDGSLPGVDTSTCAGCHSGTGVNPDLLAIHMSDAKAGGRTWDCEICHNNPEFNTLISDAINGVFPGTQTKLYCTNCHEYNDGTSPTLTPYAPVFPHGDRRHNIQGINNCVVCHNGLDVINDIHIPGAVSGANSCDTCHGSTDPNVSGTIAAGGGTCADCHGERYTHTSAQSGPPAHDITVGTASCANCHTVGNFTEIVDTHRDTCATCHGSGDPTVQNVIATGGAIVCNDCHSGAASAHHATSKATSGRCDVCHVNSQTTGVGPTAPLQMACKECHVAKNQNGLHIISYRLSNGDGTQPTSMVNTTAKNGTLGPVNVDSNGYVVSHTINASSPIQVYDFRSCFACHNGSWPGAAAVAPFHGYPGDASQAYIETGMGLFNNKTIIGGGTIAVDEVSGNNSLPLVYMYYHPGHLSFRRFGETRTMTRRSAKAGYSENGELYRDPGTYVNSIRGNTINGYKIEDLTRQKISGFATGECIGGGGNHFTDARAIACQERKSGSNPYAGQGHETPVSGYDLRIASIPYTHFSASDGNAPAGSGYGNLTNVPYFNPISMPSVTDTVVVTEAFWTESTTNPGVGYLTIKATSSSQNAPSLTYTDSSNTTHQGVISGSHYEWTFTDVAYVASVTVNSSEGGSGTATVENRTCATCSNGGGDPAANHANYNAVPNATLDDGTPCANCHTNGNLADYHYQKKRSCTWCHGSPVSGVDPYSLNLATVVCTDCHTVDTAVHPNDVMPDHSAFLLTTDSQCVSCHTGDVQSVVHAKNGCGNCHDGSYNLKAGANGYGDATRHGAVGVGNQSTCVTCHPNRAADFQNHVAPTHTNVQATASCQTCHTGDIPSVVHTACTSCHTDMVSDGTLRAGTVGDASGHTLGSPSACADCHTSRATDFYNHTQPVDHVAKGHVTAATGSTPTTDCAGCHNPADTINDSIAHNGQCADCHTPTTGVLRVGQSTPPYGDASFGPGDCNTCHGSYGYFEAHKHKDNHIVAIDPSDLGQDTSQPCSDCHHDYDDINLTSMGLSTFTQILWEHDIDGTKDGAGACVTCHDSTRTTNIDPATTFTGVQDVIKNATGSVRCLTCHIDKEAPATHGGHKEGDGTFAWETRCQDCHGTGGNSNAAPQGEIIAGVHSNNCGFCHQGGVGGATLIGSAANATWGNTPHPCTECHTGYFAAHSHAHDVSFNSALDLAQSDSQPCANCHNDAGNSLGDWNAIYVEHLSNCDTCHQYTDADGKGTPPLTTTNDTIVNGTAVHCLTCHTPKTAPATHGGHGGPFGKDAVCTTCHTGADVVADVHGNDCNVCHNGTPGRDTEKLGDSANGIDGDARLANGTAAAGTWSSVTCLTCHEDATYPRPAIHHDGVRAQAGLCTTCHNQTLVGATAPKQMGCRGCHVDETQNGVMVKSYRLSLASGTNPTSLVNKGGNGTAGIDANGYVTSHTIGGSSPIAIYDYRVCMDCHSRGNASYSNVRNAPVVYPFHGFPGDISAEMLDDGDGSCYDPAQNKNVTCTNKTMIGGAKMATYELGNNPKLPLVFMYYHPGHTTFKRFGIVQKMSRRSSKNGYTDNERLYDGNPYNIRKLSYANGIVEDYTRNNTKFSGGELIQYGGQGWTNKTGAGHGHETPATGYDYYVNNQVNIPYTNFGTVSGPFTNVPHFADIAYPSLPDNVQVQSADWDGTNLNVTATNDDGCSALTVYSQPGNVNHGAMSGTTTCTLSSPIASLPSTVDVITSNPQGNSVTGYPVTDNSAPTPANAVDDPSMTAYEGKTKNLDVMANDQGTSISITAVSGLSNSSCVVTNNGSDVTFDATNAACTGTVTFTYTIQAADASTSSALVTVTVTPPPADQITAGMANWTPGSTGGTGSVVHDASSGMVDTSGTATSFSWSHTVGNGADRYLLVGVSFDNRNGDTITSVKYGAQNLTFVGAQNGAAARDRVELWGLVAPNSGTDTITVTASGNPGKTFVMAASSWEGVDQNDPVGTPAGTTQSDGTITVASASGNMVVDQVGSYKGTAANPGNGQTAIFTDTSSAGGSIVGGGSYKTGAASVDMTWTTNDGGDYAAIAVDIHAGAGGSTTPATLDVLAANIDGSSQVHATYNGNVYDLTNVGGSRWQLSGATDLSDTYTNDILIWSDADTTGAHYPVANNGPALTWDTVTSAAVDWDGANATVTATNDWNDATAAHVDYNGSTYDLTWNGSNWTATLATVPYVATATVWTDAGGSQAVNVTDLTANSPPAFSQSSYTMSNAVEGQAYSASISGYATDPDGDPITYSKVSGPAWLTVAADGSLSGTPTSADVGLNTFTVQADATGGTDTATLNITVDAAPTGMTSANGDTITGIMPMQNFATNGSVTIDLALATTNAGDKNNYWTLWDEGNSNSVCTGSFSGSGTAWSTTIDFSQCGGQAGLYFLEMALEDNNSGQRFKIKYIPLTLGSTGEYIYTYSDSGYSNQTTSFADTDMVYVEVNSAALDNVLGGDCKTVGQEAKMADFEDNKYMDKADFSSCTYVSGTTYRFSFDLGQGAFPSGTWWYQGEMRPENSNGNNARIGLMLEITR